MQVGSFDALVQVHADPREGFDTKLNSIMNRIHHWFCRSKHWKKRLQNELMPWALSGVELGDSVLEVGPGPGLSTEVLIARCPQLTSIEIDEKLARSLRLRTRKYAGDLRVIRGDGTALPFCDGHFSAAVCFTMLHHIPSAELQNQLFREVCRVLKPGAIFVATDSLPSFTMKLMHIRDTMVLIDPATIKSRLGKAGFNGIVVDVATGALRFRARRAASEG